MTSRRPFGGSPAMTRSCRSTGWNMISSPVSPVFWTAFGPRSRIEARMTVFKLPDLGEGLSDAEVLRWHVQGVDRIEVDAPMLAVETAKAVVEVPSPVSGTITALHAQPGDRIEIGAPLVEFAVDGVEGAIAESPARPAADAAAAVVAADSADSGTVVGHMPAAADDYPGSAALAAANAVTTPRARTVPAARALARRLGVDLSGVGGS